MTVKSFLTLYDTDPLVFKEEIFTLCGNITGKFKEIKYDTIPEDLDQLVLYCLRLNNKFYSFQENRLIIHPLHRRSVLDIWRHVKYFKFDVNIYQIMNSLFRVQNKLAITYCSDIHRRTFIFFSGGVYYKDMIDEFGLTFYDWENISEEIDGKSTSTD
jgi:hypothetical protein